MWSIRALFIATFCVSFSTHSQYLIINEISQGPSGSKEYVEFVVAGNSSCQSPVPTQDLRGIVLDDNNGSYQSGSGAGIAAGAIRFAAIPFWQAIPQGTIIVIYNENDPNPLIPADDASMSDGNMRVILPANSTLFEGQTASPSTGNNTYPTASSSWTAGGGQWSSLGMANGGDSFQTRLSVNAAAAYHAVSWGSNTLNTAIYFSGAAGGKVFSLTNGTDLNPILMSNWTSGNAPTNETPGVPNSPENSAWITSMQTPSNTNLQLNFQVTNETCINSCNGEITAQPNGGTAPYTYAWTNPTATSATITNLCPGTYDVTVTDNTGCSTTGQATVIQGSSTTDATITTTGPYTVTDPPVQLQSVTNGGTWSTTDCASCLSPAGVFNPQNAGSGTFQICYTVGSGQCADNDCVSITVTQGCTPQTTQEIIPFCSGDSVFVFGSWESIASTYSQTYTDMNGCDSMHQIVLIANNCSIEPVSLFIPNTFTPNADNINDLFKIELLGGTVDEGFIFSRWGNKVKQFSADDVTWDGKSQSGDIVADGVYTYIVFYTQSTGEKKTVQGFVTVIK